MAEFDDAANQWDENPNHFKRSEAIASAIIETNIITPSMTALEFGAGTGILSNILKDRFNRIVLMDNSSGMIKMIEEKIERLGINNFKPVHFDLAHNDYHDESVDIVFSQMVMHHVEDIKGVFQKLYSLTNKSGYIAIADLYSEDGSFHGDGFDGHLGFDPAELKVELKQVGYSNVQYKQCYTLQKETAEGEICDYPIFLIYGQKK